MEDKRRYRGVLLFTFITLISVLTSGSNAQDLPPPAHGSGAEKSLPPADIPVLEHALGDLSHDSVVNIVDLLRLRDILAGRGPAPSAYEQAEADLTADGNVTDADLELLRNILLRKAGVPHLIDSNGGIVRGDGITLTIPPGAVDSLTLFSITRYSEPEFASQFGVDTKSAEEDSVYFMASFQITSSNADFKLPLNATIKLDSVPPCAYQGLNGLFAAVPDRDGDGRAELFLINELEVNADSLTLTTKHIPVPVIESLSSSQVEPGRSLTISGYGFSGELSNIGIEFRSVNTDASQSVLPYSVNDSSVVLVTPGLPHGEYILIVHNALTGLASTPHMVNILPPRVVSEDIRTIIVNFEMNLAMRMDSISSDSLFGHIEDTTVKNYFIELRRTIRLGLDSTISLYLALSDSMINQAAPLAAFIQNRSVSKAMETSSAFSARMDPVECNACDRYLDEIDMKKERLAELQAIYNAWAPKCIAQEVTPDAPCFYCLGANGARKRILEITDILAALQNAFFDCSCRNCGGKDCDKCKQTNFIGFGPKGKISGGFGGGGGFGTTGVCVNIKKYNPNECANVPVHIFPFSPVPVDKPANFECPTSHQLVYASAVPPPSALRPHAGSIVRITNVPVPYNIVGVLNDNGNAFIPHVPFSTKLTFSIYDPATGFIDPDAGTYTSGSTAGGFDRPILLFQPNTAIRIVPIHIGDVVHDSISPSTYERTDYVLTVGASDTASLLSTGFRSSVPMALKIEDPDGTLIVDSMNTTCYPGIGITFSKIGAYRIRISFGTGIQPGSYTFGIHYYPDAPIDKFYMCGRFVLDTLFQRNSPYIISDPVGIPPEDTIFVEPGVILSFDHNGSILSQGSLRGIGSHESPIRLQPFNGLRQANVIKQDRSARSDLLEGKEVQP